MKKILAIILVIAALLIGLVSCSGDGNPKDDKFKIVCTIFPIYDWVRNIVGENSNSVDVHLLVNGSTDLHSYQPSADDMITISHCDMFIYIGGESDVDWVHDVLSKIGNDSIDAINLIGVLGDRVKFDDLEHSHEEELEHSHEVGEFDEHIWLSLKNAEFLCGYLNGEIAKMDEKNAAQFQQNSEKYIEKLAVLDTEYTVAAQQAMVKTVLFADRFPFRYLMDDYHIAYYAAFSGCSAETEASFEMIKSLSEKVDEFGLTHILVTESADKSIANTVKQSTKSGNQDIFVMDSMQSVNLKQIADGVTYLLIAESNLNVLKQVLN